MTALGCQSTPDPSIDGQSISDLRDPYDERQHSYILGTSSESDIDLKIRLSKAADDLYCREASIYSQDTISAAEPSTRSFSFSQMASPNIALYEWHLCFEHEGTIYKGWRGFDPGPGSTLAINCNIPPSTLEDQETDRYLCSLDRVSLNRRNYGEYAALCSAEETDCRRFESSHELEIWNSLNRDPRLTERLTLAVLEHDLRSRSTQGDKTHAATNPMPIFLSVEGDDPTPWLMDRLRSLDVEIRPGSDWVREKGMAYSVNRIKPISEESVSLVVSTYCGPLCASGSTVVLVLKEQEWKVASHDLNWIS